MLVYSFARLFFSRHQINTRTEFLNGWIKATQRFQTTVLAGPETLKAGGTVDRSLRVPPALHHSDDNQNDFLISFHKAELVPSCRKLWGQMGDDKLLQEFGLYLWDDRWTEPTTNSLSRSVQVHALTFDVTAPASSVTLASFTQMATVTGDICCSRTPAIILRTRMQRTGTMPRLAVWVSRVIWSASKNKTNWASWPVSSGEIKRSRAEG